MTIVLKMKREWQAPADALGNATLYPRDWTGPVEDEDAAGFAIAIGVAEPARPLPAPFAAGLEVLKGIVAEFRELGVEPTCADVRNAVANLAEMQTELAS